MINRVVLTGRLTKDLEVRYTQSGVAVARFNLAVSRQFKNKQTGERETDFIACQIWRQGAENLAKFTHKGALLGIDGQIQTSHYTGQDGKEVYRTDVIVNSFALLSSQRNENQGYQGGNQNYQANQNFNASQGQLDRDYPGQPVNTESSPFNGSQLEDKEMAPGGGISTEDLPF